MPLRRIISFSVLLFFIMICFSCNKKDNFSSYIETTSPLVYISNNSNIIEPSENAEEVKLGFVDNDLIFNPYFADSEFKEIVNKMVFSSLFYYDSVSDDIKPLLIDNYDVTNNRRTYTFELKSNIYFNNGDLLTAKDVVSTFNMLERIGIIKNKLSFLYMYNEEVKITEDDKFIFSILLENPNENIRYGLEQFIVLPKDVSDSINVLSELIDYYKYNQLAGSGPFKIEKLESRETVFVRNKHYFRYKNSGFPLSDKVIFKIFPDNNRLVLSFYNNEIDILPLNYIDYNNLYNYYSQDKNTNIKFIDASWSKDKIVTIYNCYSKNSIYPFRELSFRKEIASYISKYHNSREIYEFDTELSFFYENNELTIDTKLIKDTDGDGISEYDKDIMVHFSIIYDKNNEKVSKVANEISDSLKLQGISVNPEGIFLSDLIDRILVKKEFDIALMEYNFTYPEIVFTDLFQQGDYSFYPYFSNKDSDTDNDDLSKLEKIIEYFPFIDSNEIDKKLSEVDNIMINNVQFIPTIRNKKYYLVHKNIENFHPNGDVYSGFTLDNIERIISITDE